MKSLFESHFVHEEHTGLVGDGMKLNKAVAALVSGGGGGGGGGSETSWKMK